ncbi:hypothetical protein AN476_18445 [Phaeobacter sp. 11ANDIMAR09]|nr:hypothetical protein AN476_18445 [Phaeobacter sp. 11ANDIMAR09]
MQRPQPRPLAPHILKNAIDLQSDKWTKVYKCGGYASPIVQSSPVDKGQNSRDIDTALQCFPAGA